MSRRKQARPVRLLEDEDENNLETATAEGVVSLVSDITVGVDTDEAMGVEDNLQTNDVDSIEEDPEQDCEKVNSNVDLIRTETPNTLPPSPISQHHEPSIHLPHNLSHLHTPGL